MNLGPLRPGDRVALLGTAGPPTPQRLADAEALVRGWGLEPVRLPSARARHQRAEYLSGSDAQRAADFQQAWTDPELAGVFVIRGGYGTVRILDLLSVPALRAAAAKPVYGSSDVTALHEFLREQIGVPSWFTPMIATPDLLEDPAATEHLHRAVFEPWRGLRLVGEPGGVRGEAIGTLIGGNLSLLAMTLAARSRPPVDNRGTIVLLEDVGEETYKLDGYLASLLRAGWFAGVTGIVLGSWKECSPEPEIRALVAELLGGLGVPIGWGFDLGHGPGARSVPLGVPARLRVAEDSVLTIWGTDTPSQP